MRVYDKRGEAQHAAFLARRWGAGAVFVMLILAPSFFIGHPKDAAAHDIRIGSRTALSANIKVVGTYVTIDGFLRDNLGQGIHAEDVRIDFEPAGSGRAPVRRDARTDRTGRFHLKQRLAPGSYGAVVSFAGHQYYLDAARFELGSVSTERSDLELLLQAPKHTSSNKGQSVMSLSALTSGQPAEGVDVVVRYGRIKSTVRTGANGGLTLPLDLKQAQDGKLRLWARFEGSPDFRQTETSAEMRVVTDGALALEAENVRLRLRRGLRVRASLADQEGPVEGVSIAFTLKQGQTELLRAASSDEDGIVELFVPESELQSGPMEVKARASLEDGAVFEARPVMVQVTKTGFGLFYWILSGFFALGFVALVVAYLRQNTSKKSPKEEPPPAAEILKRARRATLAQVSTGAAPPLSPQEDRIIVRVVDAQTGGRPSGVDLVLKDGESRAVEAEVYDGDYVLAAIPRGTYILSCTALGYVTTSSPVKVPHSGALGFVELQLTPVRVVVRALYREFVEAVIDKDRWQQRTPRQVYAYLRGILEDDTMMPANAPEGYAAYRKEVATLLAARTDTSGDTTLSYEQAVAALVSMLEEVYYSDRLADESLIPIAETLSKVGAALPQGSDATNISDEWEAFRR